MDKPTILKSENSYNPKTKKLKRIFKTLAMLGTSAVLAFGALGLAACKNQNVNGDNVDNQPTINQPITNEQVKKEVLGSHKTDDEAE